MEELSKEEQLMDYFTEKIREGATLTKVYRDTIFKQIICTFDDESDVTVRFSSDTTNDEIYEMADIIIELF